MPSPLVQAGAIADPSKYAPLYTNRFFTGLWTQRNPLREAAVPFLYEKFYSGSRFDSLLDGFNTEVTTRLTLARRAGHSVYNSQIFPPINRFYEFRIFSGSTEIIKMMADCVTEVWDATGPNTKTNVFTKSAGAGSSYFQSVGNTLYFGNGVDQKKWVQSAKSWAAGKTFVAGDFIVDPNNNLQVAIGADSSTAINVQITANVLTLTTQSQVSKRFIAGVTATLSNFIVATYLNGQSLVVLSRSYNQVTFAFVHANVGPLTDTGTIARTGGATGGPGQPGWSAALNGITTDGNEQWICRGSAVQNWGITAPTVAPTATNADRPAPYPVWAINTFYSPFLVIKDSNGNLQQLTTSGITGAAPPVWNVALGGTTADGSAVWTNIGTSAWQAGHAYNVGDVADVTFTYWVTVPGRPCFTGNVRVKGANSPIRFDQMRSTVWVMTKKGPRLADLLVHDYDGPVIEYRTGEYVVPLHLIEHKGKFVPAYMVYPDAPMQNFKGKVYNLSVRTGDDSERHYILETGEVAHNMKPDDGGSEDYTYPVTVTRFFQCTQAGVSGGSQPAWQDGTGVNVPDNTMIWTNTGSEVLWATIGATAAVNTASIVIDANGNLQQATAPGKSGAVAPTWSTTTGATTLDNTISWINKGPFSGANSGAWIYSFAGKNSVTGTVSTSAPVSSSITLAAGKLIAVQGNGFADTQVDVIQVYRIAQGGSTLLLLDEILAPANGAGWSYSDVSPDSTLSLTSQAAIANTNDPPPAGAINPCYHLGRIFVSVNNTVFWSLGPDTLIGNRNENFRPLNAAIFPSKVTRLWSSSIGLLVFTVSDIYIINGQGTSSSGFYPLTFLEGFGLLSYDAFCVNGSTAYLFTTAKKQISLDPGAGVNEVGFPIGDQFESLYDPTVTSLAWHEGSSKDTALYVGDGAIGWFRMATTSAPETGVVWSPQAQLVGGCKAIASVEVSPGIKKLLVGQTAAGPILQRDSTVNTDNGHAYGWGFTIGSIVLAQPGQIAELEFFTVDSLRVGTRPKLGLLLGEISGPFEPLYRSVQDPPLLPRAKTLFNDRYYCSSNQQPTICRHFQLQMTWNAEDAHNELLAYTIYGAIHNERR